MRTAREIIAEQAPKNPGFTFAVNPGENAIAYKAPGSDEYVPCAAKALDGAWYGIGMQILANGEPAFGREWIEV